MFLYTLLPESVKKIKTKNGNWLINCKECPCQQGRKCKTENCCLGTKDCQHNNCHNLRYNNTVPVSQKEGKCAGAY